jgi:hypothetical protein
MTGKQKPVEKRWLSLLHKLTWVVIEAFIFALITWLVGQALPIFF